MIIRDESFTLFYEKSIEELDSIEAGLLELEQLDGDQAEAIVNGLFRQVHNIKGSASFYEMENLVAITHRMETLLGMLRTKHIQVDAELIAILLSAKDWVGRVLEDEDTCDISPVTSQLDEFIELNVRLNRETNEDHSTGVVEVGLPGQDIIWRVSEATLMEAQNSPKGGMYVYLFVFDIIKDIEQKGKTPQEVIGEFDTLTKLIESKLDIMNVGGLDDTAEEHSIPLYLLCATIMDPVIVKEILGVSEKNLRVLKDEYIHIPRLDDGTLVDITSETIKKIKEKAWKRPFQIQMTIGDLIEYERRLALHSSWEEDKLFIQDLLTSPTVETMENTFKQFLSDLSKSGGKRFDFDVAMEPSDTMLYFLIAFEDEIKNLLANAVAHGIETPQERIHVGKSMAGTITVNASVTNQEIKFSVFDNGSGMNLQSLHKYGDIFREKGVRLSTINEDEAVDFILHSDQFPLGRFNKELDTLNGRLQFLSNGQGARVSVHIPL